MTARRVRAEVEAICVHIEDLVERSQGLPLAGSPLGSALARLHVAADDVGDVLGARPLRLWEDAA